MVSRLARGSGISLLILGALTYNSADKCYESTFSEYLSRQQELTEDSVREAHRFTISSSDLSIQTGAVSMVLMFLGGYLAAGKRAQND